MAVIILGHAHDNGAIDLDCIARVAAATAMRDQSQVLILAGGRKATHPVSEAEQMHQLVRWTGPILLEEYSRTTAENAWCALELAGDGDTLTLVCSRAHALRSWIFFTLAARNLKRTHPLRLHTVPSVGWRAWWYEMRYLHHIPRNCRSAKLRRVQMLQAQAIATDADTDPMNREPSS